ncbi:hypothetical protein OSTOST_05453, partial [Ostertagia ostertagi]
GNGWSWTRSASLRFQLYCHRHCRQLFSRSPVALASFASAHLLSRAVRKRLSNEIANLLAITINDAIQSANAVQRTTIQLLFDCRVLSVLCSPDRVEESHSTDREPDRSI